MTPETVPDPKLTQGNYRLHQCPGCFAWTNAPDLAPDGFIECEECGEKMTLIDLRAALSSEAAGGEEKRHQVEIEFDGGGTGLKLIHPEDGCTAPLQCGVCAADLTDPEAKRCHDCKDMESEGCWLQGWFDNLSADDLLHGTIMVPIEAEWDFDHPVVNLVAPTPSRGDGEEGKRRLNVVIDFLASWRYCPVSEASSPSRSCLEDAGRQLLAALSDEAEGEEGRS